MVVVVLPTPPFWLHMAMMRAGPWVLRGTGSGNAGIGRPVGPSPPEASASGWPSSRSGLLATARLSVTSLVSLVVTASPLPFCAPRACAPAAALRHPYGWQVRSCLVSLPEAARLTGASPSSQGGRFYPTGPRSPATTSGGTGDALPGVPGGRGADELRERPDEVRLIAEPQVMCHAGPVRSGLEAGALGRLQQPVAADQPLRADADGV